MGTQRQVVPGHLQSRQHPDVQICEFDLAPEVLLERLSDAPTHARLQALGPEIQISGAGK
jgi:hypothetical protein